MSNVTYSANNNKTLSKTALVIIDIQNDYFDGGLFPLVGPVEASLKAKQVLEYFRCNNAPVFHVQHISAPDGVFFLPGTAGAEIHENVKPIDGEVVVVKHYPNSFRETILLSELQKQGIENLVIVGMMTHMCIDATTRAAKDFGFNCTLVADACATRDLEINNEVVSANDAHNAFLSALSFFYAEVVDAKSFV